METCRLVLPSIYDRLDIARYHRYPRVPIEGDFLCVLNVAEVLQVESVVMIPDGSSEASCVVILVFPIHRKIPHPSKWVTIYT